MTTHYESKETVMASFGVKYEGGVFDFKACSDMPAFMSAFTAACEAEAATVRAKVAAEKKGRGNSRRHQMTGAPAV